MKLTFVQWLTLLKITDSLMKNSTDKKFRFLYLTLVTTTIGILNSPYYKNKIITNKP